MTGVQNSAKVFGVDAVIKLWLRSAQGNGNVQSIPIALVDRRGEPRQFKEEETLRTSEVLFQHPVTLETAWPSRQQRLSFLKPDLPNC